MVPSDTAIDARSTPTNMPNTLFDTGLCVDRACTQISPDVRTYTPQFVLWADTASKRRWYQLPPGTQIDTTDMDHWEFPVGTKFWKEFTQPASDGTGNEVRVETRFITRIGSDDTQDSWFYVPYQWNLTNDDTTAVPSGVMNAERHAARHPFASAVPQLSREPQAVAHPRLRGDPARLGKSDGGRRRSRRR